jgi:hypothetical protein
MKLLAMSKTVDTVVDLIRLRRWTFRVLSASPVSAHDDRDSSFPDVSLDNLRLFFDLERCASPLMHALERDSALAGLPPDVRLLISQTATADAAQVLRAEREARLLGKAVHAAGENIVLLKGAVPAVLRVTPPLPLHDVDILVTDRSRGIIERTLESWGYERAPHDEPHHACWYAPRGRLTVEVHWTPNSDGSPIDPEVWSRAAGFEAAEGLRRLDEGDQILHVLRHVLVQNRDEHVSIRDVLLLSWLEGRSSRDSRDRVSASIGRDPRYRQHRELLRFAVSVGTGSLSSDPFEDEAILHLAAAVMQHNGSLWRGGPAPAWQRAATVAAGRNSLKNLLWLGGSNAATGIAAFASIQQRFPGTGAFITRAARPAFYLASATVGVPLLLTIRSTVRERLHAFRGPP